MHSSTSSARGGREGGMEGIVGRGYRCGMPHISIALCLTLVQLYRHVTCKEVSLTNVSLSFSVCIAPSLVQVEGE